MWPISSQRLKISMKGSLSLHCSLMNPFITSRPLHGVSSRSLLMKKSPLGRSKRSSCPCDPPASMRTASLTHPEECPGLCSLRREGTQGSLSFGVPAINFKKVFKCLHAITNHSFWTVDSSHDFTLHFIQFGKIESGTWQDPGGDYHEAWGAKLGCFESCVCWRYFCTAVSASFCHHRWRWAEHAGLGDNKAQIRVNRNENRALATR